MLRSRAASTSRRATARFVEVFIRPHGLAIAATPVFVSEVEKLGSLKREPVGVPAGIGRAARRPDTGRSPDGGRSRCPAGLERP